MSIISGRDSKLQIGLETVWGTPVATTVQLPFTSEGLSYVPNYIEEDALVGKKTSSRMDVSGVKTEGDISMLVKPDAIGLVLGATLGEESVSETSSGVFAHVFTPVAGGASGSLPHLTVKVDRKVDVFEYVSMKINELSLASEVNDYLRADLTLIGYDENENETMESVSSPSKRAFQFRDGAITVDGSSYVDVTSLSLAYTNTLEDDLYTMQSGSNMKEIEPQQREITADIDVLYSAATNATRTNKFKTGDTAALVVTFISTEAIDGAPGEYYTLKIEMPLCYVTAANPAVGGPDRITQTLSVKATEDDTNEAITITLSDDKATTYI